MHPSKLRLDFKTFHKHMLSEFTKCIFMKIVPSLRYIVYPKKHNNILLNSRTIVDRTYK